MKRIWLDYIADPPGWHWPGWSLLATGMIMVTTLVAYHVSLLDDIDALEARTHRLERQTKQTQLPDAHTPSSVEREFQKQLVATSAERWIDLFDDLEAAADDTVTLLNVVPGKDAVALEGEAQTLMAALAYVDRLKAVPSLHTPELTEFGAAKNHPYKPIRFTLQARWPGSAE